MLLKTWTIDPFLTQSEINTHEHWHKSATRHTSQKWLIKAHLKQISVYKNQKIVIYLWRISSHRLDTDNLPTAFKWVRDAIAELIYPGQAPGRADDTEMIEWKYGQEKGKVKQKAIKIEVYAPQYSMSYKPPVTEDKAIECTLGVKFTNDLFLMKSFLDKKDIKYEESDLEDGPLGKCLRIKRL